MNWFENLFVGSGIAHSVFLIALVIAVGMSLGRIKIGKVSLGVTLVLFVGILFGALWILPLTTQGRSQAQSTSYPSRTPRSRHYDYN